VQAVRAAISEAVDAAEEMLRVRERSGDAGALQLVASSQSPGAHALNRVLTNVVLRPILEFNHSVEVIRAL
jgi:hypothetical protein